MVITLPERISYQWATVFATGLLCTQLVEHTSVPFALCNFGFILAATVAVNLAGGLYRPAGAYIFFNALLTMIVGLVTKAVLGEPANSNLVSPDHTAAVYLVGMMSMMVAAYVETRYRKHPPLISKYFGLTDLRAAYIGSVVIGLIAELYFTGLNVQPEAGTFASAFRNANSFLQFAVILGVIYNVRVTNGRKSLSPLLVAIMVYQAIAGAMVFSKQGCFAPGLCWAIGACLSRYRLKPVNYVSFVAIGFFAAYFATPFIQYGKGDDQRSNNPIANFDKCAFMITHMSDVRRDYQTVALEEDNLSYFDRPEGIFDRLQMIGPDDALIEVTDRRGTFGYAPVIESLENLIPHVIWPNKPNSNFGNIFQHEVGGLAEEDHSTGIAFGLTADMYHQGGWIGVLFVETASLIAVFWVFSRALGDVRDHPAVMVSVLLIAHVAPEGGTQGLFLLVTHSYIVLVLAFTCSYILPIFASVFEPKRRGPLSTKATLLAN